VFGGIAIAGNLLAVASTDARGRVYLFDLEDERLASSWTWSADEGGASDASGVAFDRAYNIYVADTRCDVVRSFSPFGLPGRVFGEPHDREQGSTGRDARGRLDRPHAVAVHDDVLLVACGERWLVRGVQRFALGGTVLPPLRAFGDEAGRFGAPQGLWADAAGIWVADTQHGVVQRFRVDGSFVAALATNRGEGTTSRPLAVLPLVALPLQAPAKPASPNAAASLLVADAGDAQGLVLVPPVGPLRFAPANAELVEPSALARDARGRVHVLDRHGERVVRLNEALEVERVVVDLLEVGFGS
jgi:hypothetical protein